MSDDLVHQDGPSPDDPFLKDLQENARRLHSQSIKERTRGVVEIGQIAWISNDVIQTHISSSGILKDLVDLLEKPVEPITVKVRIVQSVSVICRNNRINENVARELGLIEILARLLDDVSEELRDWSCHALFFLISENPMNQERLLKSPKIMEKLGKVSHDNWSTWFQNEAHELSKILEFVNEVAHGPPVPSPTPSPAPPILATATATSTTPSVTLSSSTGALPLLASTQGGGAALLPSSPVLGAGMGLTLKNYERQGPS
ncbi:hypothetical protein PAPYR_88 [Paratrimastix pyriformis]|uniref:Uncharacterized protein n=1 Tax=Paratrimastix pyriformis TaxID=342808 RepID=A0ABQ8UUU4_9EUKA|nr:hypothetical protein PAPYR_88 [Paratrimastix pyriformis]